MKVLAATVAVTLLVDCHAADPRAAQAAAASAVVQSVAAEHEKSILDVRYSGRWQIIHRDDGRFHGESARSFDGGDSITIVFSGSRLRIFGIRGKNGGTGSVVIPGRRPQSVDFYAPRKQTHVLVYDSGTLPGKIQTAGIVVTSPPPPRHRGYVNVDELDALPHS